MNFYVPNEDEVASCNRTKTTKSVPSRRRATRILGRRYALTPTAYKLLEIGISVGATSYVEMILADTKGSQIVLSFLTWQALMQKRADIERLVQAASTPVEFVPVKDDSSSLLHAEEVERVRSHVVPPILIHDLTIDIIIISDFKLVRFTARDGTVVYMKPSTVQHLFDFEDCIDHMQLWLCQNTYLVNEKFVKFVDVVQRTHSTSAYAAAKAIHESAVYDSGSIVDCEVVTCAIPDVLHAAWNN